MLSVETLCLESRWNSREHFTILDMDFASGARFLGMLRAWQADPQRPARLHVLGLLPRLPDAATLLSQLIDVIPESSQLAAKVLVASWPLNLPGLHRIDFENGAVTLTLGVGDQSVLIGRLRATVDLFCLNREGAGEGLKQDDRYIDALLRLAHKRSEFVLPEGLEAIGRGIADRLGRRVSSFSSDWDQFAVSPQKRRALVVGAGFAGMGVAHALALRGWAVTVIDKNSGGADQHKGPNHLATHARHASAALTPMVARDDNLRARLSRAGSLRAEIRWGHISEPAIKRCGAIQLERVQGRVVDLAAAMAALKFPVEWSRYVDAVEASALSGMDLDRGGIFFSTAAQIRPQELLDALSRTAGIQTLQGNVERLHRQDDQWLALDARGQVLAQADYIVVASALDSFNILNRSGVLPDGSRLSKMHALAGEITFVPEEAIKGGPKCIVSGDGYVLPAQDGFCVTGSSYAHGAEQAVVTSAGQVGNIHRAAGLLNLPELPDMPGQTSLSGWAGWRAVLPGRLPMIGPVPDTFGLWVACGFASRGLTWAPLAGDLIAAALNAEPLPLENDIIEAISAI